MLAFNRSFHLTEPRNAASTFPRLFIAAFLLWQVLFPLWQLHHGSDRYDWAMFRFPHPLPLVEIRSASGQIDRPDVSAWIGYGRGDLRITDMLWPQFCSLAPRASAVRLTQWPGPPAGSWHQCK
jgi:hypothetical protein